MSANPILQEDEQEESMEVTNTYSKSFEAFADQCCNILERTKKEICQYEQEYEEILSSMQQELQDQDANKQQLTSQLQTAHSHIQRFMELLPQALLHSVRASLANDDTAQ